MAALGEITIVFATDDFKNAMEARKYLHKELFAKIDSNIESVNGYKGKFTALDVTALEVYDDVD
jgi:hypothetical protein